MDGKLEKTLSFFCFFVFCFYEYIGGRKWLIENQTQIFASICLGKQRPDQFLDQVWGNPNFLPQTQIFGLSVETT
jgi:hypothetical protein